VKYENPEIPEGINVTRVHPLKEFALLAGGALFLVLLISYLLGQSVGYFAHYIPFEMERDLVQPFESDADAPQALQSYLDRLAGRITAAMALPEGMEIKLHYSPTDTVNAFATLGGHVILFRGLLEKLPHENALTMLIAHEIAHIKHRDPIVGLSRGLAIQTFISLILGHGDVSILANGGRYTALHFSREMESAADREALKTYQALYGHTAGADALFKIIQAFRLQSGGAEEPEIFRTHPLDQARIDSLTALAKQKGWRTQGEITPLPTPFKAQWLIPKGTGKSHPHGG